jgi:FixJ family two-component response regulator
LLKRPVLARILRLMNIEDHRCVVAIVDDDQRVLESLGELLESAGYSVRLFDSAEAFLRADAVNAIDALISDIRMPGVDGIELQRRLGIIRSELPVILITARTDVDPAAMPQPNNRGVFRKPVDATELIKAIEVALKGMT